jgi:hypothetical protein
MPEKPTLARLFQRGETLQTDVAVEGAARADEAAKVEEAHEHVGAPAESRAPFRPARRVAEARARRRTTGANRRASAPVGADVVLCVDEA